MTSPVGYYRLGQSWPRQHLREDGSELYRQRRGSAAAARFIIGNVAGSTPTPIVLGSQSLSAVRNVGSQRVYTRGAWADGWTLQPYLWCDEAAWSASPSIPTASFRWHYGSIAREAQLAFATWLKLSTISRVYVKVEFDFQETSIGSDQFQTRTWYGILEIEQDAQDGVITVGRANIATGEQRFTAYGMEKLLEDHLVTKTDVLDTTVQTIGRAIDFNAIVRGRAIGNRSSALQGFSHCFDDADDAVDWSSFQIVRYLLDRQTPKDTDGNTLVPFDYATGANTIIPDWDRPVLPQEGRSTLSLIASLVSSARAMSFHLTVDESYTPDRVFLNPFTFTDSPIPVTLEGAAAIAANTNRVNIDITGDATSRATIKATTVDQFDQVVVRGARATSTFNFAYNDGSLDKGWTATQQTKYNDGGKNDAGYPDSAKLKERRLWNIEARSRPDVEEVYSRFTIATDWTGEVNDGEGNATDLPAFPASVTETVTAAPAYFRDLRFNQRVVFLADVDYSTGAIASIDESSSNGEHSSPFCYWKLPDTSPQRWQNVERIGRGSREPKKKGEKDNRKWSANLSVDHDSPAIRLEVSGQPQHVIAKDEFVPLSPNDKDLGENNWKDAIFVVSADMPYHCESAYPTTAPVGSTVLTLTLDAGDAYRLDYVAPQTVVGIGEDGALQRTAGGWLHDESDQLTEIARMAYTWFNLERNALYLETESLTQQAWIGNYLKAVNLGTQQYRLINAAITEVRYSAQISSSGEPEPPMMSITTNSGELDAVRIFDASAIPAPVKSQPITLGGGKDMPVSPGLIDAGAAPRGAKDRSKMRNDRQ